MPQMQILCPQCKQPIVAEIRQLFDVGQDPAAKQEILSGLFNIVQCPHCGYQGPYPAPLVYHDPDKELLLVFVPPELGLSQHEQEKFVGPLLQQIMRHLPAEKRKAYLLNPQQVLSLRSLQERILEADGITKEMLEAEERRVKLLQRLLSAPEDALVDILKQEDETVDARFFQAVSQLIDAARTGNDEVSAQRLEKILNLALEHTTAGQEQRAVIQALQDLEKRLAALGPRPDPARLRTTLVDWLAEDPSESRLQALVALAMPLLDYGFYQALSERIEQAPEEQKAALEKARDRLLELSKQVEEAYRQAVQALREAVERLSQAQDVRKAVQEALPWIDQDFLGVLAEELEQAKRSGDEARVQRLQRLWDAVQEALAPPPEVQLLDRLLAARDKAERERLMEQHADLITPDLLQTVTQLVVQAEQGALPPELKSSLQTVYNELTRFSMLRRLKGAAGEDGSKEGQA